MSRAVTLVGYVVLGIGAIGVEVAARRRGRHATFREALAVLLSSRPWQLVVMTGWLWLGWHLFARVDW